MTTRRQALKLGAGALALGAGGLNLETTRAHAQSPKRGGTLTFAISAETPHYDGHGSDTFATIHFPRRSIRRC
jgi:peptide/nickel transport system substrate-binding protein